MQAADHWLCRMVVKEILLVLSSMSHTVYGALGRGKRLGTVFRPAQSKQSKQ